MFDLINGGEGSCKYQDPIGLNMVKKMVYAQLISFFGLLLDPLPLPYTVVAKNNICLNELSFQKVAVNLFHVSMGKLFYSQTK